MDISKLDKKKKNSWIFDDTFPNDVYGIFVEAKDYKTNSNKDETVIVLDIEGIQYLIMPFKLDYTDFVEKYDSETEKWCGKQFRLTHNSKGKYKIVPIEEKI